MKLSINVDKKSLSLNVNSQKSLQNILIDDCSIEYLETKRDNNCIVLLNNRAVISSLIPAFLILDSTILTFEGYKRSKEYKQVLKACEKLNISFDNQYKESIYFIIEDILISSHIFNDEAIIREFSLFPIYFEPSNLVQLIKLLKDERGINV